MDKAIIRREMLARRAAMGQEACGCAARGFTAQALAFLRQREFSILAGYAPIRGELDIWPLLEALAGAGKTVCLPVMQPGSRVLKFRRWEPGMALVTNRFGIAEPPEGAAEVVPEVLLVPLLAFDARGHRLGYGGGYYDATLAVMPEALSLGCGYDWQGVETLPAEPQDRLLNWIITEKSVRKGA